MSTISITSLVRPQFLMRGERVHATRSATTWPGQVVTVRETHVSRSGVATDGVPAVLVDARDAADRPVFFFVPLDGWAELAD